MDLLTNWNKKTSSLHKKKFMLTGGLHEGRKAVCFDKTKTDLSLVAMDDLIWKIQFLFGPPEELYFSGPFGLRSNIMSSTS